MIVTALFFASYRDIAGADELDVELGSGCRVADLVDLLRSRGGGWAKFPKQPVVAVNMEYADLGALLSPGDEVAFIPPVSGG